MTSSATFWKDRRRCVVVLEELSRLSEARLHEELSSDIPARVDAVISVQVGVPVADRVVVLMPGRRTPSGSAILPINSRVDGPMTEPSLRDSPNSVPSSTAFRTVGDRTLLLAFWY